MSDTTTRRHEGRYTFGKRQDNGRTPVYVDGATEPSGYVWTTGHGAEPWVTEGSDTHRADYPSLSGRRWQAAERIVDLIDVRADRAAEEDRRRSLRDRAPEGWRLASWDEIVTEGYRRIRLISESAYVDSAHLGTPDGGERYPVAFVRYPIRLNTISRHGRARESAYGDFLSVTFSKTGKGEGRYGHASVDGNHTIALGALVPVDTPRRTVSAAPCPKCGAHEALYATGARTMCGVCTAGDLGWSFDDLPYPIADEDPFFDPGDVVAYDVPGVDQITDTYTGTVVEWTADLSGNTARNVRVDFPHTFRHSNCAPAMLRKVDAIPERDAETVGGFRVGSEVVHTVYNRDGVAFTRNGMVAGFSDCPQTGVRLVRVAGIGTGWGALPLPVFELYRRGDWEGWQNRPKDVERCGDCGREVGRWEGARPGECPPGWRVYCVRKPDRPLFTVTFDEARPGWQPKTYRTRLMTHEDAEERVAHLLTVSGIAGVEIHPA